MNNTNQHSKILNHSDKDKSQYDPFSVTRKKKTDHLNLPINNPHSKNP